MVARFACARAQAAPEETKEELLSMAADVNEWLGGWRAGEQY